MTTAPPAPLPIAKTALRLLTFRISREELMRLDTRHLAFGLACAWIVGIGRYWDDPDASLLQHSGIGSVIYVFALTTFLWALIAPLRPENFSYRGLLTFVALTSPPAALYAIPVERIVPMDVAQKMNLWFLAAVASLRVALLFFYLMRLALLRWYAVLVASLLPLALIVTGLTFLNLERRVINIMGGLSEGPGRPDQLVNDVLLGLTYLAFLTGIPLMLAYLVLLVVARARPGATTRAATAASTTPEMSTTSPE
jgi:hypothetical protein